MKKVIVFPVQFGAVALLLSLCAVLATPLFSDHPNALVNSDASLAQPSAVTDAPNTPSNANSTSNNGATTPSVTNPEPHK